MRKLAIQRKGGRNTYGGTELDWIHINSFDFLDDGNSLVLSSREQSSILKIKNIYTKPELDYVIHRGTIYNGTDIAKYQLKREGDFVANAGQHMITVEYDDSLPEGQYYLYMFNHSYICFKFAPLLYLGVHFSKVQSHNLALPFCKPLKHHS